MPERLACLLDRSVREGGADLHGEGAQWTSALTKRLQSIIVRPDEIKRRDQIVRSWRVNAEMYQVGLEILFDRLLGMEGDRVWSGRVCGQQELGDSQIALGFLPPAAAAPSRRRGTPPPTVVGAQDARARNHGGQ